MSDFSERNGYIERPLQIERMSDELRNRIWNTYRGEVFIDEYEPETNYLEEIMDACGVAFNGFGGSRLNIQNNLTVFYNWFMQTEWYRIYDFIEIYLSFLSTEELNVARDNFNSILRVENAGYRIVGKQVVPITNPVEIVCVEESQQTAYSSVNIHIKKASELLSRRPQPDYENSIKESISAVEAMCCIITGESGANATLGKTIKKLKDNGVHIHSALENAFSSMYGYTSDENGIRHGGIDFTNAPAEDAKYMLVSCSAFVNYLIEKWSETGNSSPN